MAVGKRVRVNFIDGVLTYALSELTTDTTITSDGLVSLPIVDHATTGEYVAITVGAEVMHITAHANAATTATVERATEGSTIVAHGAGAPWEHGPTELDFSESLEDIRVVAAAGATPTIDTTYPVHDYTLTANATFTFTGAVAGWSTSFTLVLRQDAVGGWTTSWPAGVRWNNGTTPTLSSPANSVDIVTFMTVDGGSVWYGFVAGTGMA